MSITKVSVNNVPKMSIYLNKKSLNKNFSAQQSTPIFEPKSNSNKLLFASVALLLIGGLVYFKRDVLGLPKLVKSFSKPNLKKIEAKVAALKDKYRADAHRVLNENTHNNMVNLSAIEPAAAMRSASKTEENAFHQAASWLEEAYKGAYSKAELKDGNNILDYIHRRIGLEDNTLAQMYAQMPKPEAEIRVKQFALEALEKDSHSGMTADSFIESLLNKFIPKAKQDLGLK